MSRFASLYPSSQRSKSQYRPPLPGPRSFRPPFVGQHHPPGIYQPRTPLRSRPPAPFIPRSSGTNYPRPRDPLGRKGSSYLQNQPQEYTTDVAYANPYNREYFQANPNQQTEPFNQESWETEQQYTQNLKIKRLSTLKQNIVMSPTIIVAQFPLVLMVM